MDILIRAKRERVEHKFKNKVPAGTEYCYWTGIHPRNPALNIFSKVMFTNGLFVYAEGKILDVSEEGLCFEPLREVNYLQPKVAPTRGFTYVEGTKNEK